MKTLDQMAEQTLRAIIEQYDGNQELNVMGSYDLLPEDIKFNIRDVFEKLKSFGLIAGKVLVPSGWSVCLTSAGLSYFETEKHDLRERVTMYKKLPEHAEGLLKEILLSDDAVKLLTEKLGACSPEEGEKLRGWVKVLSDYGFINTKWGRGLPVHISTNLAVYLPNVNELLVKAIKETESIMSDEIFLVGDLFKGYEWNRISHSDRLLLGTLFLNYVNIKSDSVIAIEKTSSGEQQYTKK